MQVTTNINVDLIKRGLPPVVYAVQGEYNTRAVKISMFCDGIPWSIPGGASAAFSYDKESGASGVYRTLPNGDAAIVVSENSVSVILSKDVLMDAGKVFATVLLHESNGGILATFPFIVDVFPRKNSAKNVFDGSNL